MKLYKTIGATFLYTFLVSNGTCDPIRVLSWNVESGSPSSSDPSNGNDRETIASQLTEFDGYDIVALTEVNRRNVNRYIEAIGGDENGTFIGRRTETGGGDRMVIIYDDDRFDLVGEPVELSEHNGIKLNFMASDGSFRFRSPFVLRLRESATGMEFLFMVNHLARGDSGARRMQARGLREWGRNQVIPIIAVGDYNFDFNFMENRGNAAYDLFIDDDIWQWVEPSQFVDTNWADKNPQLPNDQRDDRFPNSILDFVFVAGPATSWQAESSVIVRDGDLPDSGESSDHRPVEAVFVADTGGVDIDRTEIKDQIQTIRNELDRLEGMLNIGD